NGSPGLSAAEPLNVHETFPVTGFAVAGALIAAERATAPETTNTMLRDMGFPPDLRRSLCHAPHAQTILPSEGRSIRENPFLRALSPYRSPAARAIVSTSSDNCGGEFVLAPGPLPEQSNCGYVPSDDLLIFQLGDLLPGVAEQLGENFLGVLPE